MVSFKISSLFAIIPLKKTIDIISQHSQHISIPRMQFRHILYLCTENVQFQFNGKLYCQADGLAMEIPSGPVVADIFILNV